MVAKKRVKELIKKVGLSKTTNEKAVSGNET